VVIKPNVAWDRAVEQAANTNPLPVAEVTRLCCGFRLERRLERHPPGRA
jgi:hypothetical protein